MNYVGPAAAADEMQTEVPLHFGDFGAKFIGISATHHALRLMIMSRRDLGDSS